MNNVCNQYTLRGQDIFLASFNPKERVGVRGNPPAFPAASSVDKNKGLQGPTAEGRKERRAADTFLWYAGS